MENDLETKNNVNNLLKQRLEQHEKSFCEDFDINLKTNPIVRKFVEFSKSKYKFSIRDFYFK